MVHFGVRGLPDQLDYAAAVLALSVEGFLFRWHQGGNFKGFTNISSVNDMKNWLNVAFVIHVGLAICGVCDGGPDHGITI